MCGVIGVSSTASALPVVALALRRMEYRGYDSAGAACVVDGQIVLRRVVGDVEHLVGLLQREPLEAATAIGHTRWATHGAPSVANAHPHATIDVAVVHNGIIENHQELRHLLQARGHRFMSATDSEVVPVLLSDYLAKGMSHIEAITAMVQQLHGSFALGMLFKDAPNTLYVTCRASPLLIATNASASFFASDVLALAGHVSEATALLDGDVAVLTTGSAVIAAAQEQSRQRKSIAVPSAASATATDGHAHFTHKEIFQQPKVASALLRTAYASTHTKAPAHGAPTDDSDVATYASCASWIDVQRVKIVACGTSYYAGMLARSWFEALARLPVDLDVASEFRYRDAPLDKGAVYVFISQSGETADTLSSLRYAREHGVATIAIVNVADSSIAREADARLLLQAGPEIGVASTKAFTAQLIVLARMALAAASARGTQTPAQLEVLTASLRTVPQCMLDALAAEPVVAAIAPRLVSSSLVLYLGRQEFHALALEGALKLKELSYVHAEGFAAGEMKHGPLALVEANTSVVVLAPHGELQAKTLSNLCEVRARGARIILITDSEALAQDVELGEGGSCIVVPRCDVWAALVFCIPLQLLAYHAAISAGRNVDKPRNLAKSVTVE